MRSAVALVLVGVHLVYSAKHSLQYFYTGVSGEINFPEYTAVGLVDGQQFVYFDSNTKKAVPKTDWIRQNVGEDYWNRQTQGLIFTHKVFKSNIQILKERFNQSGVGVHTFQRMYGCEWNDETGETDGFNAYGYDGEDFLSLDFREMRFISPVQQALPTVQKWNDNKGYIQSEKQYFCTVCIEWLKKYLQYGEKSLKKTVSPQVSLLQKDPSSAVLCHATGFYPSGVKISWMKDKQDHYEDVDIGELIPNEDGTFQKTSTLKTSPDEWKQNRYSCVVEHQGETINTILTEKDIKPIYGSNPIALIVGIVAAIVLLAVIGAIGYVVYQKKGKKGFVPANNSDDACNNSSQGSQAKNEIQEDCKRMKHS